jgi:hypothetical protein
MSKTILEQALDHLLNKEEDQASALLHDYYVGIGRKVYEDIMADDVAFEDTTDLDGVIDDVESDLTEEGDELESDEMDDEADAAGDLAAELGDESESEAIDADAGDVADAMMDVESALAKLKAEFEEMVSGAGDEMGAEEEMGDMEAEEEMPESIGESAELTACAKPDNSDKADEKRSPVAGKNPVGARPAVKIGASSASGVASGTTPASAPKAQDMGGTTKPNLSKVSTKA